MKNQIFVCLAAVLLFATSLHANSSTGSLTHLTDDFSIQTEKSVGQFSMQNADFSRAGCETKPLKSK